MLMTPEEAAQTDCPLMRYCVNEEAVIHSAQSAIYYQAKCCGPHCKVGWRWASALTVNNPSRGRDAAGGQVGQRISRTHGYCGFAGRPE